MFKFIFFFINIIVSKCFPLFNLLLALSLLNSSNYIIAFFALFAISAQSSSGLLLWNRFVHNKTTLLDNKFWWKFICRFRGNSEIRDGNELYTMQMQQNWDRNKKTTFRITSFVLVFTSLKTPCHIYYYNTHVFLAKILSKIFVVWFWLEKKVKVLPGDIHKAVISKWFPCNIVYAKSCTYCGPLLFFYFYSVFNKPLIPSFLWHNLIFGLFVCGCFTL